MMEGRSRGPSTPTDRVARGLLSLLGLSAMFTLLSGCASVPAEDGEVYDPRQGINRKVQTFNDGADKFLLKPIARGYHFLTPDPLEKGISNFFRNLNTPWVAVNQLLQGKPKLAGHDTGRFLINSIFGIGGFLDVADGVTGLEPHQEDFGQTLAVWGVPSGPYTVVPFLGPATPRDGFGNLVGLFGYPVTYIDDDTLRVGLGIGNLVQTRASFLSSEQLVRGDRYLFMRDAYLQRREFLINDGEVEEDPFLD
ncbi:MAG: VacJ family lipoprotein [Pseudomonadota bacterium]